MLWICERPGQVVMHRLDGVQRAERILEDHLHLRAVAEDALTALLGRDVAPVEDHAPGGWLVEAQEQTRDGALAAAALADECRDAARPQREAHVVDGMHALA